MVPSLSIFSVRAPKPSAMACMFRLGLSKSMPTNRVVSIVVPIAWHQRSLSKRYSQFTKQMNMDGMAYFAAVHSASIEKRLPPSLTKHTVCLPDASPIPTPSGIVQPKPPPRGEK